MLISEFTSAGGEEFSLSGLVPFIILGVLLSSGKVLAAVTVATSMQLTYSTQFALNIYEKRSKELVDMLKNQGLSSEFYNIPLFNSIFVFKILLRIIT